MKVVIFVGSLLLASIEMHFTRVLDSNCGRALEHTQERYIVGGRRAKDGEFPWMVSLQHIINKTHFCGGSLIASEYVLTAAHCAQSTTARKVRAMAGYINVKKKGLYYQIRNVSKLIIHERYGPEWVNDIALLRLAKSFNLEESEGRIGTICLPRETLKPRTAVTASGWGRLSGSDDAQLSNTLRAVVLKVRRNSFCKINQTVFKPQIMFCAGGPGKDTCDRDSGGPVVQTKRGVTFQVGIVSFGMPCGQQAGYYTRVSSYTEWIEDQIVTANEL